MECTVELKIQNLETLIQAVSSLTCAINKIAAHEGGSSETLKLNIADFHSVDELPQQASIPQQAEIPKENEKPKITLQQLATAGANFVNRNPKDLDLLRNILKRFNAGNIKSLKEEDYDAFADAFREIGGVL